MLKFTAPSTVDGIKRYAKKLKNELGIPLYEAQHEAARRSGFQNLIHAQSVLAARLQSVASPISAVTAAGSTHRLFVSASWADRESDAKGLEVWWVDLSAPYSQLLTRMQMRENAGLARLEPRAPDHLFFDYRAESQERARHYICRALRTLQFVDATKLRPSKTGSRIYPEGNSNNAIPGHDHSSGWYDPVTKGYVFVDEPYEPAAIRNAGSRTAWATQHSFAIAKPTWPGMYLPNGPSGSQLYLVASIKKGPPLGPLVAALNRLPPPQLPSTWLGMTTPSWAPFVSPGALDAPLTPPKAPAVRTPRAQRPDRMPIEMHEDIGRKLRVINADTYRRDGVRKRLITLSGTLDTWIQNEYTHEQLPFERFTQVYYGDAPKTTFEKTLPLARRERHMATFDDIKATLEQHYTPTRSRKLISLIDQMVKSLATWQ